MTFRFRHRAACVVAAATLLVLANPFLAASAKGKVTPSDPVEARIKAMRANLHITSAQESLWNNVAQAMRENAKAMADIRKERSEHASALNAVDELKSYGTVIEAHEDGLHKFIPVFQALYESMSDAQKKTADTEFRRHARAEAQRSN